MTVQEVVLDLLSYANIYGFQLSGVPEDEMEIVRAVAGVNHAIQIIGRDGPASLKYAKRSSYLPAVQNLTGIEAVNQANRALITGDFQESWRGCSLLLDGDSVLNRIMDLQYASTGAVTLTSFVPSDVNVPQNKFNIAGHGLENDDEINFVASSGGTLPAPIAAGTTYFVINASANSFQISTTLGGATLVITNSGTIGGKIITPPSGKTVITLLRPYGGRSATIGGVLYGDCVMLDPDVTAVLEPVTIPPNTRLYPAQDSVDFQHVYTWNRYAWPYYWICPVSGRHCCYIPFWSSWEKTVGNPQRYRVERRDDSARKGGTLYLSVNPMPTAGMAITYDVYRTLWQIDRSMLAEDGGDDPNIDFSCLPEDLIESFLLPIARWKYMSAHPALKNVQGRANVKTEYDEAMLRLKNGMSVTPQVNLTRARYL